MYVQNHRNNSLVAEIQYTKKKMECTLTTNSFKIVNKKKENACHIELIQCSFDTYLVWIWYATNLTSL